MKHPSKTAYNQPHQTPNDESRAKGGKPAQDWQKSGSGEISATEIHSRIRESQLALRHIDADMEALQREKAAELELLERLQQQLAGMAVEAAE